MGKSHGPDASGCIYVILQGESHECDCGENTGQYSKILEMWSTWVNEKQNLAAVVRSDHPWLMYVIPKWDDA